MMLLFRLLLLWGFFLVPGLGRGETEPPPYYMVLNYGYSPATGYRLMTMDELTSDEFEDYYIQNGGIAANLSLIKYQNGYACNVFVEEGWLMYPESNRLKAEMLTLQLDNGKNNCTAAGSTGIANLITDTDCSKTYNSILFPPNATTLPSLLADTFPTSSTCDYPKDKTYANYSLLILDYTSENQTQALKDFYDSTGGDTTWIKKTNWMKGDPCLDDWYGISCSYSTISGWNVSNLQLQGNGLTGTIPSSFSTLVHLHSINLKNNSLSGTVPPLLPLDYLNSIQIDNNTLSGSLPPIPSSLSTISCSYNQLNGTFPSFSARNDLNCHHNEFTRADYISVSKNLDLSFNLLEEFSDFYRKYYHTSGNSYTWNLANNQFREPLPDYPITTDNTVLHLENNFFTGDLTGIGGKAVYLTNNALDGKVTGDFSVYPESLYIKNNSLHGKIDPAICTKVTYQSDFSGNNFACPIPWCLPSTPCHSTFDTWPIYLILIFIFLLLLPFVFFIVMSRFCGVTFSLFSYQRTEELETNQRSEKFSFSASQLQISGIISTFLFAYCILTDVFSPITASELGCHSTRPDNSYDKCELVGGKRFPYLLTLATAYFWLPVLLILVVGFMGCWCSDSVLCCDLRAWGHNRCVTFCTFVLFALLFSWSCVYIAQGDCYNAGKDNYGHHQSDDACELNVGRLSWLSFVLLGLGLFGSIASILSGRFDCVFSFSRVDAEYSSI